MNLNSGKVSPSPRAYEFVIWGIHYLESGIEVELIRGSGVCDPMDPVGSGWLTGAKGPRGDAGLFNVPSCFVDLVTFPFVHFVRFHLIFMHRVRQDSGT